MLAALALSKPADRLLFFLTLLLVFFMSARAPVDTDMYWALRVGKEIVEQRTFVRTDPITYTHAGNDWVAHSWLFDVWLYGMYAWLQYHGLVLLVALLAMLTMGLLWLQLSGPAVYRTLAVVFTSLIAAPSWTPRPQMVTMLLLCLVILLLLLYRKRQKRVLLFALPPVMILWANLHGGYILGLGVIGIMVAGELLDRLLLNTTQNSMGWLQWRDLVIALAACTLATLVTPYGFGTWEITVSTFGMRANAIISEWHSPDFNDPMMLPFLLSLIGMVVLLAVAGKKLRGWEVLTLAAFVYFALSARRQVGVYAIAVMPIIARTGWAWLRAWGGNLRITLTNQNKKWRTFFEKATVPASPKENKAVNLLIVGLLALVCWGKLVYVSMPPLIEEQLNPQVFPVEAIEILKETPPAGNLFNEYDWGGYLSWFAPQIPVYIDARADLFGDDFIFHWWDVVNANTEWKDEFARWQITAALVKPGRALARELREHADWQVVYGNGVATLYVKK
ncbi:MAG TPA: hypothetical protein ENN32_04870 [Chloroflexi bacterium]|nr:hypothetical protein [Chloroflexota bacterium]